MMRASWEFVQCGLASSDDDDGCRNCSLEVPAADRLENVGEL